MSCLKYWFPQGFVLGHLPLNDIYFLEALPSLPGSNSLQSSGGTTSVSQSSLLSSRPRCPMPTLHLPLDVLQILQTTQIISLTSLLLGPSSHEQNQPTKHAKTNIAFALNPVDSLPSPVDAPPYVPTSWPLSSPPTALTCITATASTSSPSSHTAGQDPSIMQICPCPGEMFQWLPSACRVKSKLQHGFQGAQTSASFVPTQPCLILET